MMGRKFRLKNKRQKANVFLLLAVLLVISVGFALMSTALKINGTAGVKGNTWDIHWDDTSIQNVEGSVIPTTSAHVIDAKKTIVSFEINLDVPGDFYEFTLNAINEGTVNGKLKSIKTTFTDENDQKIEETDFPYYIKYSLTHKDGSEITLNEVIEAGKSDSFRFRIEYDQNIDRLPTDEELIPQIKPEIELEYELTKDEDLRPYTITFDPNGGHVGEKVREVERGNSLGSLPVPTNEDIPFEGWYTDLTAGYQVSSTLVPRSDAKYVARWAKSESQEANYSIFDEGKIVNAKLKGLAGDDVSGENPYTVADTAITSIEISQTAPASGTTTENVAKEGSTPILAWFENGVIKLYSEAEKLYLNADSSYMFNNIKNATSIYTDYITSNATNMSSMFANTSPASLDLSNFDTSNVTDMTTMFSGTTIPTISLNSFDTSNVTNMSYMFAGANIQNISLSSFNTSNVTNMSGMFTGSRFTSLDLSSFDVSNVTSFGGIFSGASSLQTLDISGWNFDKITSLTGMFNEGLSSLETLKLNGVNTSKITDMTNLFYGCSSLENIDLSSLDTSNVTSMVSMFNGCTSLKELDLSTFDISKVTNFGGMFSGTTSLESLDISGWNFDSTTNLSGMFSGLTALKTINLKDVNTSKITNMAGMFSGCSSLTELDLSGFDTTHVTSMGSMLGGLTSLETLNISNFDFTNWNTSSLMMNMTSGGFQKLETLIMDNVKFQQNCTNALGGLSTIKTISLNNANTSNVTNMTAMFTSDSQVTALDLRSFDTSHVTSMGSMFSGMTNLTTITVSDKFVVDQVTSSDSMFGGDTNLVGGQGTTYDSNHIDKAYAHYDYGNSNPGYFDAADDEESTKYTVTFNPNGGSVNPTTKQVVAGHKIGSLPVPEKANSDFRGWYTGITDGIQITSDTIVDHDMTIAAHWNDDTTIIYDANNGSFSGNQTEYPITYQYKNTNVTKYSHTANIDDEGTASGTYASNLSTIDKVTIPGSEQLSVEVWFSTEGANWDWLAIYANDVTPTQSNYAQSISGKLGGGSSDTKPSDSDPTYHRTFIVNGDTAQFYFRSDSGGNNYGYYAVITGISKKYSGDKEYKIPTRENYEFTGWSKNINGTGKKYNNESEIVSDIYTENLKNQDKVYANWTPKYTITFNPNEGTVQEPTRSVISGNKIGKLPVPTKAGHSFLGWYTLSEIKVDATYIPNSDETLYAHWNEVETMFDIGKVVNKKLKYLSGAISDPTTEGAETNRDNNITSIVRTTTAPDLSQITYQTISVDGSKYPIYAWFTNGTIYWYTDADIAYANPDSSYMFAYFESATSIDTSFDTSFVQNATFMLSSNGVTSYDVSGFNTSNMTDMNHMFYYNQNLTAIDLSNFDTSKATNMVDMIGNMHNLVDINISNFDFTAYNPSDGWLMSKLTTGTYSTIRKLTMDNVIFPTNMYAGLAYLDSIQQISLNNVDTSHVTNMQYMFEYWGSSSSSSTKLYLDLSSFDTSNVTNMEGMFYHNSYLTGINLSSFDTRKVTNMEYMFYYNKELLNLNLSNFDVSHASINNIFHSCDKLQMLNISNWDLSNCPTGSYDALINKIGRPDSLQYLYANNVIFPANMTYGLGGLSNLVYISLQGADTSNVTTMKQMFTYMSKLTTIDLSSFDTRKVMDMSSMFYSMPELTTIYVSDDFVVDQVASSGSMFGSDTKLVGGAGTVYDSNHIDKAYAHYDGGQSNPGYFNKSISNYTITLNANGGEVAINELYVKYGNKIGTLPIPNRTGYTFNGWRLGTTDGIKVNEEYIPNADLTLVAEWIELETYTITLDPNSGTVSPTSKEVYTGDKIGVLPIPERTDYGFAGWYTDPLIGIKITESYIPQSNMTLHARWMSNKNIIYDATPAIFNNGQNRLTASYVYNDTQSKYMSNYYDPNRTGYKLLGWTRSSDGTGTVYQEEDIQADLANLESNTVFYAKWKKLEEYTITFNPNGGTIDPNTMIVYSEKEVGILPTPARYNKYFLGWYTDLTSGTKITNSYIPTGDITVYAHWIGDSNACSRFSNSSWDDIMRHLSEDNTAYPLGCTKTVKMGNLGTYKVQLINNTNPAECSNEGFSQTGCGFVLDFYNIISRQQMQTSTSTNAGGWESSRLRNYINTTVYNSLPNDLKKYIINTKVVSGHGSYESNNFTTTDKLYLLSEKEIFNSGEGTDTAVSSTRQLDYYRGGTSKNNCNNRWYQNAIKPYQNTNTPESYWLRTASSGSRNYFVDTDGCDVTLGTPVNYFGIAPAFRIGLRTGWYFENEGTWNPQTDEFKDQKWQYYVNGEKIESGVHNLIAAYDGSGQTKHNFLFVDGYMYVGWYTDETTGNKYFYSWFDRDNNGYVEGHRFENMTYTIDGTSYTFDANGVCTNCN